MAIHSHDMPADAGDDAASEDPVQGFVAEVASLARSIDPMLAVILGAPLEPPTGPNQWTRGRRSGLEFCLTMLGYARAELHGSGEARRIDRAIGHIALELSRFHRQGQFAPR